MSLGNSVGFVSVSFRCSIEYDYHTNIPRPDSVAVPTLELRNTADGIASHQVRISQKPDDLARFDPGDRFAELHQPIGFDQR